MKRPPPRIALALLLVVCGLPSLAEGRTTRPREHVLGRGKPWQTSCWVHDGAQTGPTVMVVGGLHGNEPGGAYAAGQVRHWPLRAGRLVVLPRANVRALAARKRNTPGVARSIRNANRNFPDATATAGTPAARPRGELATAIWSLLESYEPDWLLDLHEGHAFHRVNRKSEGHTIIVHPARADTQAAADAMIRAVDRTITDPEQRYSRLRQVTRTMLARSAGDHFGTRALILETCYTSGPLSRRAHRHRVMVHTLLSQLEMLAEGVGVEDVLAERRRSGEIRVAVYDADGTGGRGVPRVLAQLGAEKRVRTVRVCAEDIRIGVLDAFDVVTFTGGTASGQARSLGAEGREVVRAFVEGGGGYIGICAGAYLAAAGFSWSVPVLDAKTVSNKWRRGRGVVEAEMTPAGRRVFGSQARSFRVLYHNGPVIEPLGRDDLDDYDVLAYFRTELAQNGSPRGVMRDSPAMASATYGRGRVVWISGHPEQTEGLEAFVPNAVRWARRR